LFEFNNPASDLTNKYSIKLFRSVLAGNYNPATFEEIKEIKPLNDISYNEGKAPAFRLAITNTSSFPIWLTNAYLGFDYSITTDYFEPREIGAGMEYWLTFVKSKNPPTNVIPMGIDKQYLDQGYKEIKEYIKLFISVKKIDTNKLSQKGVNLPAVQTRGGINTRSPGADEDDATLEFGTNNSWKTETIGFRIIRS